MKYILILILSLTFISGCKQEVTTGAQTSTQAALPSSSTGTVSSPTVRILANASDNIGVTKVEFYVNNAMICADLAAPYYCDWTPPLPLAPSYSMFTKAYDSKGNVGTSATVSISGQN